MAILNKIRQRTFFLIVIIALALFAFVIQGVLDGGGSGKAETRMGTINGEVLDRDEFTAKVEIQKTNMPNADANAVMNQVWNQEVRRVLMEEQYEKLGLRVERAQLNTALAQGLAGNPQFQNDLGLFDENKMLQYIADAKANTANPAQYQQWLAYEKSVEQNLLQETYNSLIKGGLQNTLAEGEQQYRFENDKINFQFVTVPYTAIPDTEVTVSEDEIKAYINNHKDEFQTEAQTDIEYVSFSETPSATDIANAQKEVALLNTDRTERGASVKSFAAADNSVAYVNEYSDESYVDMWTFGYNAPEEVKNLGMDALNVGDVVGPYKANNAFNLSKVIDKRQLADSIKSSHILIRWQGSMRASSDIIRTKEEAKQLADSLLNVIKRTPSKYEEINLTFSDDETTKENEGDLGYFSPNIQGLADAYKEFIVENNNGEIGLAETAFGFHIIKITDKKNSQTAVKLATITKEIEASTETINEVFSSSSKFEVAAKTGDYTALAQEKGLTVRPVNKIGELDANIPGVESSRQIITWSFDEETKVGDVKRFNTTDGYVVARVTRKVPKGLMSVADASAKVNPILRNEKKAKLIRAKMTGDDLQSIATANSVSVQTATAVTMSAPTIPGAGSEPKVVGVAFGKAAGETTALIDGNTGVFKIRVTAVNNATTLENYASFANQLNNQNAAAATQVFNAIKEAAEIDDNRATFY